MVQILVTDGVSVVEDGRMHINPQTKKFSIKMRLKNFLNLVVLVGISLIILSLKHSENFSQEPNALKSDKIQFLTESSFVSTNDDFYNLEKKERTNIYEPSLKNKFISSRAKPHLLKGNTGNIEK